MVALHPGTGVCRLLYVWTSRMGEIDTEIGSSSDRAERLSNNDSKKNDSCNLQSFYNKDVFE